MECSGGLGWEVAHGSSRDLPVCHDSGHDPSSRCRARSPLGGARRQLLDSAEPTRSIGHPNHASGEHPVEHHRRPVGGTLRHDAHSRILLLSSGFQLVEASRGQGDHETNVRNFSRDAKSVAGDTDDDNCANLVLPASALSMNAAIIQAAVVASGEASESDYREARKAGQELMDAAGITDTKFGEDMFGGK